MRRGVAKRDAMHARAVELAREAKHQLATVDEGRRLAKRHAAAAQGTGAVVVAATATAPAATAPGEGSGLLP